MVMDEEIDLDALKSYSAPDILICGNCRLTWIFIFLQTIFQSFQQLKIKIIMSLASQAVFRLYHASDLTQEKLLQAEVHLQM